MSSTLDAVRETTVLAKITAKAFGISRTDKTASRKVAEDAQAAEGTARVIVSRLPGADDLHKRLVSCQLRARASLHERSMPWAGEDGWRLLPSSQLMPLMEDLKTIRAEFDDAMSDLVTQADDIIARAQANMGSFSVPVPTRDELIDAYTLEDTFQPVPDGSRFQGLPPDTVARLQEQLDKRIAAAIEDGTLDVLRRTLKPVEHLAERLAAYSTSNVNDNQGEDDGRARRTVLQGRTLANVQAMADVLDAFNVTSDPRIAQLVADLAPFKRLDIDRLKEDAKIRGAVQARLARLAKQIRNWTEVPSEPANQSGPFTQAAE